MRLKLGDRFQTVNGSKGTITALSDTGPYTLNVDYTYVWGTITESDVNWKGMYYYRLDGRLGGRDESHDLSIVKILNKRKERLKLP